VIDSNSIPKPVFLQPVEVDISEPDPDIPEWAHYLTLAQMNAMLPLSTEEVSGVMAGAPVGVRLAVARGLHDLRRSTQDERAFEEQVEINRARKRAKHEADRRDAEERAAYLTSEAGRAAAAQAFEADIIDLDDLEDPEPLIEGFLHRDTLVRTFGPPKSLKSFVTLDMAASISLGIEWQGRRTVQTNVLYIVAEGARGVKKRRNAWNEHHGTEMKVIFYPKPVQIGDQEEMYRVIAFCLAKQIGYIVFDTQARCTVGVDENDNTEMGEIVAALDILKQETKACVHMVHHSVGSDPKKARGATAWDGAVDAEFYTKRDRDADTVDFVTKFQKDISEAETLTLATLEVGASLVLDLIGTAGGTGSGGAPGDVAPALVTDANMIYLESIRTFGPGGATVTDVVADFEDRGVKRSRTAVKKGFGALLAGGAVQQQGRGTAVVVTQQGLVALDVHRRKTGSEGLFPPPSDPPE
jgi:hypothetical protein